MDPQIAISGIGSISPLGASWSCIDACYSGNHCCIQTKAFDERSTPVGSLGPEEENALRQLTRVEPRFDNVDRSTQLAVVAARQALQDAEWQDCGDVGVNIGSSRGATGMFEQHFRDYLAHRRSRVNPMASPSTTLGNISSWVGQAIGASGVVFSHSMTCSTAAHAVANGVAWLRAGMAKRLLVGGAEAALTGFTIAQMRALRLYSDLNDEFPCRPLARERRNSVVLGEGAAVLALERSSQADRGKIRAQLVGVGYGTEPIGTGTSMSADAQSLQRSMQMAISDLSDGASIDAVIMHAPGTAVGDAAELAAVNATFPDNRPLLLSNKWRIGHTFGASAALSLEFALHLLENHRLPVNYPYPTMMEYQARPLNRIMINSTGFGGNAVSLIVERPISS
jgi:3-oxoacyl-[acyl-carrier-protein] synthase II